MKLYKILNCRKKDCEELFYLREEINKFVSCINNDYNSSLKEHLDVIGFNSNLNKKSLYDSVWGTIEVSQVEMYMIDSPLFQRLKYINQLGLVNLLYPSATHKRFSHSLGVMHASDIMTKKIFEQVRVKN